MNEKTTKKEFFFNKLFQLNKVHKPLFFAMLFLLVLGAIFVYSTTIYDAIFVSGNSGKINSYIIKHIIFIVLGFFTYFIILKLPTTFYRKHYLKLNIITLVLMIIPLFFEEINGAKRWISLGIGDSSFQPAELAKLMLILLWATVLSESLMKYSEAWKRLKRKKADFEKYFKLFVYYWFVPIIISFSYFILFRLQVDNGSLVITIGLVLCLILASGINVKKTMIIIIVLLVGILVVLLAVNLYIAQFDIDTLHEMSKTHYIFGRFIAWVNPFAVYADAGYQLSNSLIAISEGGLFGRGIGNGQQKLGYLSEGHNDFIIANIAEEAGALGVGGVYIAYLIIIFSGYKIAQQTEDMYKKLLVLGLSTLFFFQAFWNSGGVTGLIPLKGLTAPLLSYGGTSLLFTFLTLAVIQRVYIENNHKKRKKHKKNG